MSEIKKITPELEEKLRTPLPSEAVKDHPTKPNMSAIKAIYVVERLNEVFGTGEWKMTNEVISVTDVEAVGNKKACKMVVVKSVFTVNGYNISIEQFGGNDNADLGDAYKGAATDALTKIGSYLGIGMEVFKGLKDNGGGNGQSRGSNAPQATQNGKGGFDMSEAQERMIRDLLESPRIPEEKRNKVLREISTYNKANASKTITELKELTAA